MANVKFISFEPLLYQMGKDCLELIGQPYYRWLDWVIIGQQTPVREATMPKIEWIEEILSACNKADIPVFLKNNLKPLWGIPPLEDDILLRQEMPK